MRWWEWFMPWRWFSRKTREAAEETQNKFEAVFKEAENVHGGLEEAVERLREAREQCQVRSSLPPARLQANSSPSHSHT